MGVGDWLMATGQVRQAFARRPVPVCVVGIDGRAQWSEVFEHNPKISRRPGGHCLLNGPNARPYIAGKTRTRWMWRPFDLQPGELFFSPAESAFAHAVGARGYVMVEPNVKANGHSNKAWPWQRWQRLAHECREPLVQCVPPGGRGLDGVLHVATATFRHACAVLANCRAFVGTEGGLHHAAAALGIPAVVLFSEFISPDITGYKTHRNLRHAGPACGSRLPCQGCVDSMNAISVEEVTKNLWECAR